MTEPLRALVTGASGFIGSRLVRHLVEQGKYVKAFVREGANLRPIADLPNDRVQVAVGDVTAMHTVYRALAGCDQMYHTAAVYKFWAPRPQEIFDAAVGGTDATLEAARRRGLSRVVVTSTMGTVGVTSSPEPMNEEHAFNLTESEAYVMAKRRAEELALERAARGEPVIVVCPGGVFGPGDWKPTPSGRLVLDFLRLPFFAAPATGGFSVVDVDDVAQGHRLAMEKGRVGERYILGGDNLTHVEFTKLLNDVAGTDKKIFTGGKGMALLVARLLELRGRFRGIEPPFTVRLVRDHGFSYIYADSTKAERELGYTHRPARQTLSRSLRWYLENRYVPEKIARELAPVSA